MKLNDKLYDVLKWIALICIPALATFYVALAGVWGWPYADEVAKTANAVCVLLGALLGISTAQYYKSGASGGSGTDPSPAARELPFRKGASEREADNPTVTAAPRQLPFRKGASEDGGDGDV